MLQRVQHSVCISDLWSEKKLQNLLPMSTHVIVPYRAEPPTDRPVSSFSPFSVSKDAYLTCSSAPRGTGSTRARAGPPSAAAWASAASPPVSWSAATTGVPAWTRVPRCSTYPHPGPGTVSRALWSPRDGRARQTGVSVCVVVCVKPVQSSHRLVITWSWQTRVGMLNDD